jgi:ferritin-like protein
MTNVVPFVSRAQAGSAADPAAAARTTASVVADLVSVVAEIRDISGRVLPLPNEPLEVERTLQALVDASSAIEHATEVLTHHGERTPF